VVSAGLRALVIGRLLHEPYFRAKQMSDFQRELFVTERLTEYRGAWGAAELPALPTAGLRTAFGFTAALLERLPLVGLVFSVSNRIGAAMCDRRSRCRRVP
jgi:hypothetical protein